MENEDTAEKQSKEIHKPANIMQPLNTNEKTALQPKWRLRGNAM